MVKRIEVFSKIPDARAEQRQEKLVSMGFDVSNVSIADVYTVDDNVDADNLSQMLANPVTQEIRVGQLKGITPLHFDYAVEIGRSMGLNVILQHEEVSNRLIGVHGENNVFNISGNLVSLIDENRINNMPRVKEGDTLIAIKGYGRSNGFTDRRNIVVEKFGNFWHTHPEGRDFARFLSEPSIIFYPVFAHLIDNQLATGVFHMSGGAYRDKLAKQIARQGLYCEIGMQERSPGLFDPDPREIDFAKAKGFTTENAYVKYAMGNEGFIATDKPETVLRYLQIKGLDARVVGRLEKNKDELVGIILRAYNGEHVDFTSKSVA